MWKFNMFMAFLIAPFLGILIGFNQFYIYSDNLVMNTDTLNETVLEMQVEIGSLKGDIQDLNLIAKRQEEAFSEQKELLADLSNSAVEFTEISYDTYEQKILKLLGPAVAYHKSDNNEVKIFSLNELGYRGYIAKVKLYNPDSFQVVLGQDELGKTETTLEAGKRKDAVFAVNGGGFYFDQHDGKKIPRLIGNTVIDGELVEPFNDYPGNLFFAGIDKKGRVIGTIPQSEEALMALDPLEGVSFIPVLLQKGEKVDIPSSWAKTNQPRTIIGTYENDDLIFIVIDGRQADWSVGVSLELLQDKLITLGVKSAYNLDGGGSSAMYFNGKLLNKPSDGTARKVINNIIINK